MASATLSCWPTAAIFAGSSLGSGGSDTPTPAQRKPSVERQTPSSPASRSVCPFEDSALRDALAGNPAECLGMRLQPATVDEPAGNAIPPGPTDTTLVAVPARSASGTAPATITAAAPTAT